MARSNAQVVREALEACYAGEQAAALARMRDPGEDAAPATRARGRFLISTAGYDALAEARERGELSEDEALWLERHRARLSHTLAALRADADLRTALARARLPSGEALDLSARLGRIASADDERARASAARELDHALRPIALQHVAAHADAERPLLVKRAQAKEQAGERPRVSPGGPLIVSPFSPEGMAEQAPRELPEEAWAADAAALLTATQGAAEEAVARCTDKLGVGRPLPWHALLRGLRASELDSPNGAKLRWRRAAAWLRGLGFERELNARMRAELDRSAVLPFATVVPLAIPRDVRVAQLSSDYGVASDVFAAGAVGQALGFALVHPALPPELRWPEGPSAAGVLGALSLQLWGEREHLVRVQQLPDTAARRVGLLSGALALLHMRAQAAVALAPLSEADKPEARQQALAEALGRALCCDAPESVAAVLAANRVAARARALESLAGLALHIGLRERFDADWFRNPRSEEPLRAACTPGNRMTPSDVCAELGVPLSAASARALELVA